MDLDVAIDWLEGKRSMVNCIPSDSEGMCYVKVAQADAAMMEQAWIVVQYHNMKNRR